MDVTSKEACTDVSIDRFFSTNYSEIWRWAMEIASGDRSISEDLIHDAYLILQERRSEFSIANPTDRVFVAIRNSYLGRMRRQGRIQEIRGHSAEDVVDQVLVQDPTPSLIAVEDLLDVCDYACSRRTVSVPASLMIFRYFLGYSAEDLSKIANRAKSVVDAALADFSRRSDYPTIRHIPNGMQHVGLQRSWAESLVFDQFRDRIFRSPEGSCLPLKKLKRAYRWKSGRPDDNELGHLASCISCLETANRLLKIETLEYRHPMDICPPDRIKRSST